MNFKKICVSGAALLPMLAVAAGGGCDCNTRGDILSFYIGLGPVCFFNEVEMTNIVEMGHAYNTRNMYGWDRSTVNGHYVNGVLLAGSGVVVGARDKRNSIQWQRNLTDGPFSGKINVSKGIVGHGGSVFAGLEWKTPWRMRYVGALFVGFEASFYGQHAQTRPSFNLGKVQVQPFGYGICVKPGFYLTRGVGICAILGTNTYSVYYRDLASPVQKYKNMTRCFCYGVGVKFSYDMMTSIAIDLVQTPKVKTSGVSPDKKVIGGGPEQFKVPNSNISYGNNYVRVAVVTKF
ncbi:MAG: hypothetical protein LBI30_02640 [Holosporales bacterium]|jgi:hypothetical protein|nr:hypothetical protein [Holosporales bacterium]